MADKVITDASVIAQIKNAIGPVSESNDGIATKYTSMFYRGDLSDCNTREQGVFRTTQSTANKPSGIGNISLLISIRGYSNGEYMIQFLVGLQDSHLHFRRKVDDTWGQWFLIL